MCAFRYISCDLTYFRVSVRLPDIFGKLSVLQHKRSHRFVRLIPRSLPNRISPSFRMQPFIREVQQFLCAMALASLCSRSDKAIIPMQPFVREVQQFVCALALASLCRRLQMESWGTHSNFISSPWQKPSHQSHQSFEQFALKMCWRASFHLHFVEQLQ